MSNKFNFDKNNTFCISLESAHTRWESMVKRFNEIDLDVTRWIATATIDNFDSRLSVGEKNCAQSHINIYRHIIENDLEYAFVLEDDACFDKNWRQKLEEFDHENWDLILLNASAPMKEQNKWELIVDNLQDLTAGYIISKNGARWILDNHRDMFFASDWMTQMLQTLGTSYCYFPWLIVQEGKDTCIGSNFDANYNQMVGFLNSIDYSIDNYLI